MPGVYQMPSRRVLLRALGAGALGSIAGCSGDDESRPTETSSEPTTPSEYRETSITTPESVRASAMPTTAPAGSSDEAGTATATETSDGVETTATSGTTNRTERTTTTADEPNSGSGGSNLGGNGRSNGGNSGADPDTTSEPRTETTERSTTRTTTERSTTDPTTAPPTTTEPVTTTETSTTEPTTTDARQTTETTTTTQRPIETTTQYPTETTTQPTTETTTTTRPPDGTGSWSVEASLPEPQSDAAGGVVDGSLYYFGGIESGENLPAVARTYRFDPADGAWTRLEDMPRALWAPCGVAAEGKLFSFGGAPADTPYGTGEPPSDEIFVYEPGAGWRDLTAETGVRCPYPNWAMGGAYNPDDGLVYLVGGGTDVTDRASASDHGVGTDDPGTYDESRIWTFDPVTEEVANPDLARMPAARRWPTVALVEVDGETCLHAICGLFGTTGPTDDNLRYRLSTGEWEAMTPAPRAGNYAATDDPVVDGTVYLTHGSFWVDTPSVDAYDAACHAYDPVADEFETDFASPEHLRGGAVDAVVDDTLYVVGGHVKRYDRNGFHDCKTANEAFTPPN